ncbi:uncharacterized protein B4U80_08391 [Leptotrombidium deliense]|uniref:BPTI/Kunitz inhibitor domain-containing protein n=1 Tax=Leptotrombidium deliense TaxID=299467 RepID=A0A443SHG9_9ACAR|nr:uncharacterized protein B4U80_08391 [Leptotrombidium deliense]
MKSILVFCVIVALVIANSDARDKRCSLQPKQNGVAGRQCKAYIPSWSYNEKTDLCEFFIYGGCGGNENRFASPDVCIEICNASGVAENNETF